MKRRKSELNEKEYIKTLDMLYTAASAVRGRDATKRFLKDLLTPSERIMLGRRVWIARLLILGRSHDKIAEELKVGMGTIGRVERWLHSRFRGYRDALKGLEREMDRRAIRREMRDNPWSYAAMKKRYPLYYLFFPDPKPKKKYRD